MSRPFLLRTLALLLGLTLCACPSGVDDGIEAAAGGEASEAPEQPTVIIVSPAPDPAEPISEPTRPPNQFGLSDSLGDFSWDAWRGWSQAPGNLLMPAHHIHRALAILGEAASEETWERLAPTLGTDLEGLHAGLSEVDRQLLTVEGVTLRHALWAQRGLIYEPAFLETISRHYDAGLRLVDFARGADAAISSWRDDVTAPSADHDVSGDLVWTSSMSITAAWANAFDPSETTLAPFFQADGEVVEAMMMTQEAEHEVARLEGGATLVRLRHEGDALSLVVLLPSPEGDVQALSARLDDDTFSHYIRQASPQRVRLSLPRVSIEETRSASETLGALGFANLLETQASWTGASPSRGFAIGGAEVSVRVTLEEGGVEFIDIDQPPGEPDPGPNVSEIRFDRPFLFALRHDATNTLLVLGRVSEL